MQPQDLLTRLQEVDLDVRNVGAWPRGLRLALLGMLAALLLTVGGVLHVGQRVGDLSQATRAETRLLADYRRLHVATVDVTLAQRERNRAALRFETLLAQLPGDAEVPALIDEISRAALAQELSIERITLGEELATTSYVELPIDIAVVGGYHQIGAFLEALAGLQRILAPQDFRLRSREGAEHLELTIRAQTWRRREVAGDPT
ncbi:MAG: type 4a pilus biogenesis protein PilO [Gammaproteobacteria bacterium]|nr:type 4a pilus biogenesis protein PilO [Gammaproteobacteria bacterium]